MAESANRVVLVTGCSSGIGLATAVLLAKDEQKRFKVYATMRNLGKKEALEKEGGEALGQTLFIEKLDVSSEEQISQVIDDIIKKEGRLDILVNNAGFGWFGPSELHTSAEIKAMFATNTIGPMLLTNKLLPHWKKNNCGHAIAVTSIGGMVAFPYSGTYCATKFATEGFFEAVSLECAKFNIRFSLIEPGPVFTNFKDSAKVDNLSEFGNRVDAVTKECMAIMQTSTNKAFPTAAQKPEEVANAILEAIITKEPNLRHITNKAFIKLMEAKYSDLTGNVSVNMAKQMFLG